MRKRNSRLNVNRKDYGKKSRFTKIEKIKARNPQPHNHCVAKWLLKDVADSIVEFDGKIEYARQKP